MKKISPNVATLLTSVAPSSVSSRVRADRGKDPVAMIAEIQANLETIRSDQATRIDALERAADANATRAAADRLGGAGAIYGGMQMGKLTPDIVASFTASMRSRPTAAMTTQSDPDGGFTVPKQVDGTIMELLRSVSPLRGMVTGATLTEGNTWSKVLNRIGARSGWAGEEDERKDTATPKLGAVEIPVSEIYAIPEITNEALEDSSFDLEQFLADDVSGEFASGEGLAFINGDGMKKPLGILAKPTSDKNDATRPFGTYQHLKSGSAGAIGVDASAATDILIDLVTLLPAPYRRDASTAWLMNSATAARLQKLKDGDGRSLWRSALTDGNPDKLLGYAVMIDEGMPDIAADTCPIAFGNWRRGYAIVDKVGIRTIVDRVTRKGWTKLYFAKRVGGGPLDTNALKFLKLSA